MPPGLALVNESSDEQADREIGSVLSESQLERADDETEEWRCFVSGPSVAFLDNVNGRMDSGIFKKLLTSPTYDHRILGTSGRRTMRNSPV